MLTITITSENGRPFNVHFQHKVLKDGVIVWEDDEVVREVGKSQAYGVDSNYRIIIGGDDADA